MCNKSRYERVHDRDFLVLEAMAVKGDTSMNGYFYPKEVMSQEKPQI